MARRHFRANWARLPEPEARAMVTGASLSARSLREKYFWRGFASPKIDCNSARMRAAAGRSPAGMDCDMRFKCMETLL